MDGMRRLFRRRVEPLKALEVKAERPMSGEEWAHVDEQVRRGWLTRDQRVLEAEGLAQRGEIGRAFLVMTSDSYRLEAEVSDTNAIRLLELFLSQQTAQERNDLPRVGDQARDEH